jgi:hypothetical protein
MVFVFNEISCGAGISVGRPVMVASSLWATVPMNLKKEDCMGAITGYSLAFENSDHSLYLSKPVGDLKADSKRPLAAGSTIFPQPRPSSAPAPAPSEVKPSQPITPVVTQPTGSLSQVAGAASLETGTALNVWA